MDRTYWIDSGELFVGETVVSQQSGLRLYDGEDRVSPLTFVVYLSLDLINAHFTL